MSKRFGFCGNENRLTRTMAGFCLAGNIEDEQNTNEFISTENNEKS